jgi:AraC-like DNA-binding protein
MNPYREQAPPPGLARWVECSWSVATAEALVGYPVRPDGCLDIVFDREQGLRVVGAMTTEKRYDLPASSQMLGIRFRPGMAGLFLQAAPPALTDAAIALEDLWGSAGRNLHDRVSQAASSEEGVRELMAALQRPHHPLTPIQRAIEAMSAARGVVDLDQIANQANLSTRQFRRRCLEESGLTPKHLCRVLRFRHACELAGSHSRPAWPAIAAEAGYFDQAHLIRDFHEFTGTTPMSVFSNTGARRPASMGT